MHEHSDVKFASISEWEDFSARHPGVEYIDAFVIDGYGHCVGKRVPVDEVRSLFRDGILFSEACFAADCRGLGHNAGGLGKDDGDPDGAARPMSGSLRLVPWSAMPTAQVHCHMVSPSFGKSVWFDPRMILKNVVAQCSAAGIRPVVACELEFYLIDPKRTAEGKIVAGALPGKSQSRRAANLSLDAVEDAAGFMRLVTEAGKVQGLPVTSLVAEYGVGQFEVNLSHGDDPLLAADQSALLVRLIKGIARSIGLEATFMAKPFVDQPGNGLHLHVSLVDDLRRNRFGASGGEELLRQGIAGLQALLFESFGLFAPNFNSQRRYLGSFVPTTRDWGRNNRSVAFRVPVSGPDARRIEHRVAGADASPHLTMAAVLAGILHGISHKLVPTEPVDGRAADGVDPEFPAGLMLALDRLERASALTKYIPADYLKIYAASRRGEYLDLIADIFPREYDFYA
jgi:glutamine synthetase